MTPAFLRPAPGLLCAGLMAMALSACEAPATPQPPADAPETPATSADASADATTAVQPGAIEAALLQADGLTPANPGGRGAARRIAFGEPQAQVVDFITTLQGGTAPDLHTMEECPAGPLTMADWGDGYSLTFQDGRFVGWSAHRDAPDGWATSQGVHVGATLPALRAAAPGVQVREESIGMAFSLDGVHGSLSDGGDEATVIGLWAGTVCIFH